MMKKPLAYLQSSSAQCWESIINQGSTVQGFAVTLKGNITHYKNKQLFMRFGFQSHKQNTVNNDYFVLDMAPEPVEVAWPANRLQFVP